MQEFIPFAEVSPAPPSCLPAETTLVAEDFSRCTKLNGTDCSGNCKMYDLAKYQKPSTVPVNPVDPTKPPVTDKFACVSVKREDKGDMATCNGLVNKEACYDKLYQGKCEWAQVGTTKPTDPNVDPTKPPVDDPTKPPMSGSCPPLPTVTELADKMACYNSDKAACDTT